MTREETLKVAKPILFNTQMVNAILEGRKTVTRRVVKPSQMQGIAPDRCPNHTPEEFVNEKPLFKPYCDMSDEDFIRTIFKEPYQIGDILYIRETWYKDIDRYMYKANYSVAEKFYKNGKEISMKWRPSIHMPKEAARIFLRITSVRAERLQEITDDEARKEGCGTGSDIEPNDYAPDEWYELMGLSNNYDVASFAGLWNSTIKKEEQAKYGWEADPWVWVYEFERVEVEG